MVPGAIGSKQPWGWCAGEHLPPDCITWWRSKNPTVCMYRGHTLLCKDSWSLGRQHSSTHDLIIFVRLHSLKVRPTTLTHYAGDQAPSTWTVGGQPHRNHSNSITCRPRRDPLSTQRDVVGGAVFAHSKESQCWNFSSQTTKNYDQEYLFMSLRTTMMF